jgi:hypothetical protein
MGPLLHGRWHAFLHGSVTREVQRQLDGHGVHVIAVHSQAPARDREG